MTFAGRPNSLVSPPDVAACTTAVAAATFRGVYDLFTVFCSGVPETDSSDQRSPNGTMSDGGTYG